VDENAGHSYLCRERVGPNPRTWKMPPSSIPADESLLRVSVLQPELKRSGQNQRELAVYAGEQGEWPAQAPILSIMVGPFLPGENLPLRDMLIQFSELSVPVW